MKNNIKNLSLEDKVGLTSLTKDRKKLVLLAIITVVIIMIVKLCDSQYSADAKYLNSIIKEEDLAFFGEDIGFELELDYVHNLSVYSKVGLLSKVGKEY